MTTDELNDIAEDEFERFSEAEEGAILATADRIGGRAGLFAWLALGTGLRIAELNMLRWSDYNGDERLMKVWRLKRRKGKKYVKGIAHSGAVRAVINVGPRLAERLAQYRPANASHDALMLGGHDVRTLRRDWKGLLAEAGVPYRKPHAARHTFGSKMAELSDGNTWLVQKALGHASSKTCDIYVHIAVKNKKLRAAVDAIL